MKGFVRSSKSVFKISSFFLTKYEFILEKEIGLYFISRLQLVSESVLVTSYFEWQAAGNYVVAGGGAMHQVETALKSFHYGFDLDNLYFRMDLNIPMDSEKLKEFCFKVVFLQPKNRESLCLLEPGPKISKFAFLNGNTGAETALEKAAVGRIIEFAIPLNMLELAPEQKTIEFVIFLFFTFTNLSRFTL